MDDPFRLDGKNIIVTGASSGIGEECAVLCSKRGANVFLIARNIERLAEVQRRIRGVESCSFAMDLRNFDEYETVVSEIVHKYGKISGLIHSAGIDGTTPLNVLKVDRLKEVFETNTFSFFELVRILSKKKYLCEGQTSFIGIASVAGFVAKKGALSYNASKAALIHGVKSLALELVSKNIRVNCVSPATILTPLVDDFFSKLPPENREMIEREHPMGLGEVNDVANACLYLLSDAAKWVTGTNLVVDGGYSL